MFLATAAAEDGEMRHFDAERECFKADIDEEIYIEIPGESLDFPGTVGLLEAVYWLAQVGRCWNIKFCDDSMAIGLEQSKSYLRVFFKVADEDVEMVVAVHVDDILVHAKYQATMETFAAELGKTFKVKDMGGTKYYMGCMITRNRKALELKLDQHLYVKSVMETFGVQKASRAPASSEVPTRSKADEPQTQEKYNMLKIPYRDAIGRLMWTATMTRPDIEGVVRTVAGFVKLWTVAQRGGVEGRTIPAPHERMENQSCTGSSAVDSEWRRHGLELWSLPEYWTLDIGLGRNTSKGGGKLALEDASSDGVRYLGGGILCLIKGSKRGYIFETGAGSHGTVGEDLHASRKIKHGEG